MFDVTSFVREKIFRRPKLMTVTAGEELSEKQTTKLGYFLLYCMFGAILASAQWTLSIINDIPTAPTSVPYCIVRVLDTFDVQHDSYESDAYNPYYDEYTTTDEDGSHCQPLTASYPVFDFTAEYRAVETPYTSILQYEKSIRELEEEKNTLQYSQDNTQKDYDTALTEKIADENEQVYNTQKVQANLRASRAQIASLTSQIAQNKASIQSLKSEYQSQALALKAKTDVVDRDYRSAYLLYKLYIALLSFAFSLIIFTVLYKMYVSQKIKNSPHTVIFSVATFAYGLVVVQVAGLFFWDMIPHTILEALLNFFRNFSPLLYLVQFLWPLIIIAIF